MAALCSDAGKRGTSCRVIAIVGKNRRHTIRPGRISKKIVENTPQRIESLEMAKATGHANERETAEWVAA